MMPLTEQEIREGFINADPVVAAAMTMPGLHEVLWNERDFLGWHDARVPTRAYVSFWTDHGAVTLLLRVPHGTSQHARLNICTLCGTQQAASQVRLFSAPKTGAAGIRGATVGTYLCDDFSCSLTVRTARTYETEREYRTFAHTRVERLQERLRGFAQSVIG